MKHANPSSRVQRHPHGAVYMAALGAAMLLTVIGLAAMAVARAEVRTLQTTQNRLEAQRLAEAGIDIALLTLQQNGNWRNTATNDLFVADQPLGDGTFKWKLIDDEDGDLADDQADPVRIVAWGMRGNATQKVSVIYAPGSELPENLIENGDFEDGATKWASVSAFLTIDVLGPLTGTNDALLNFRLSSSAGLQQTVTNSIENNSLYDVEFYARTSSGTADIRASFIIDSSGDGQRTINDNNSTTVDTNWTLVKVTLDPSWTGNLNSANFRIHTASGLKSFHVDDVTIVKTITRLGPMGVVKNTWQREVDPIP